MMGSGSRSRSWAGLLTMAVALALATPASAKRWSAVCSNLVGMRVEEAGSETSFTRDAVEGASWAYDWDTTKGKATLTLPASHASDGKAHRQEGVVSAHRGSFFVIVSRLPGAVWTHAIYPESGRLLAVQSTTRSGTTLSGRMLVGTCAVAR